MMQPLGRVECWNESQGMMAWITVEKGGLEGYAWSRSGLDKVADPHLENVPIKRDAPLCIIYRDDTMSKTLLAGFKARGRSRRLKRFVKRDRRAVENF